MGTDLKSVPTRLGRSQFGLGRFRDLCKPLWIRNREVGQNFSIQPDAGLL